MRETQSGSAQNPVKLLASLSLSKIKIFSKQKAKTQTKSKQSLSSSLVYASSCSELCSGFASAGFSVACTSLADFKIFKIILKGDRYSLK